MGWVLYSTKWVKSVYREPQHKTQPQHTTTKMSSRRPPSGGFAPLSPWAGEVCPQIIAIAGVSGGGSDGGEMRPGRNVWDDAMSSFWPSN